MNEAIIAERMTETAQYWHARSLANAFAFSGVYVPVSGDKIACMKAGPGEALRLYRERDRPMEDRLRSLERTSDQLWNEGEL